MTLPSVEELLSILTISHLSQFTRDTRVETFDQPRDPLSSVPDAPKSPSPLQAPRRSTRVRQPPKRLQDYVLT